MANVKENITAQESAYDKDGCIDLILFDTADAVPLSANSVNVTPNDTSSVL